MFGMTVGFMLRRSVLAGIIAVLMGAGLVYTGSTSAHNIDLAKAKILARDYARNVREESQGKYIRSTWNCVNAFPNHNHIVRCVIEHQNAADKAEGVYTCKETIELFMYPDKGRNPLYSIYGRHTSFNACGRSRLNETRFG
jgi:hypothetical protein